MIRAVHEPNSQLDIYVVQMIEKLIQHQLRNQACVSIDGNAYKRLQQTMKHNYTRNTATQRSSSSKQYQLGGQFKHISIIKYYTCNVWRQN